MPIDSEGRNTAAKPGHETAFVGARVEGPCVIVRAKDNDEARRLCGEIVATYGTTRAPVVPAAPIARIIMDGGEIVEAVTYMPGLPDGVHELYAGPGADRG